jgi:hypothetical protein
MGSGTETQASKSTVPMHPALGEVLKAWHSETLVVLLIPIGMCGAIAYFGVLHISGLSQEGIGHECTRNASECPKNLTLRGVHESRVLRTAAGIRATAIFSTGH